MNAQVGERDGSCAWWKGHGVTTRERLSRHHSLAARAHVVDTRSLVAHVQYTPHLSRFFPQLSEGTLDVRDVAELVRELDRRHPGLAGYLVDDQGRLRTHVNVFVDGHPLRDRISLADPLDQSSRVYVAQALSGG